MRKFNIGNKVRFTKRVPKWVKAKYQSRTRVVSDIFYETKNQATTYWLGKIDYPFRSYMLRKATDGETSAIGRPKLHRHYNRRKTARF